MSDQHFIHSQTLEFSFAAETGHAMQQKVREAFNRVGLQRLEQAFNTAVPADLTLRLPRVEIDLGCIDSVIIDEAFGKELSDALIQHLLDALPVTSTDNSKIEVTKKGERQNALETRPPTSAWGLEPAKPGRVEPAQVHITADFILHFLACGQAPWWASASLSRNIEAANALGAEAAEFYQRDHEFRRNLHALVGGPVVQPAQRLRLEAWLAPLADAVARDAPELLTAAYPTRHSTDATVSPKLAAQNAKAERLKFANEPSNLRSVTDTAQSRGTLHPVRKPHEAGTPPDQANPTDDTHTPLPQPDSLFVEDAGLVLLQPFVLLLFQELGLTDKTAFSNQHAQARAIRVMEYLCWGSTGRPEYALQLGRHLCAVPAGMPLDTLKLTRQDREECANLLRAVIRNWAALKNTSIEALQTTFLQRSGKLILDQPNDRLLIESRSYDVLIDSLPWAYGVVKFPWMGQPLMVEWR